MIETPQITDTREQNAAVIHLTIARTEIQSVMGPAISEVMATVDAQGITPAGPWFSHHLRMDPGIFDFELGVPIASRVTPAGRVQPGTLPAARVARTVYHGGYEGLAEAWREFDAWIRENGHRARADLWECYVAGPESGTDSTEWRTELNRPIDA